jgi:dienelactone hydrolase
MSRIRAHLRCMPQFDSAFSLTGLIGMYLICIPVFFVIGLGMPTGLGLFFDILIMSFTGLILLLIINFLISLLIVFIRIRIPRLLLGAFASTFTVISIALAYSNISYWGAAIVSFILIIIGFSISTSLFMMVRPFYRRIFHYCYIGFSFVLLILTVLWLYELVPIQSPAYERELLSETAVSTIEAANPGQVGPYSYQSLTYGSGMDRHRNEFGEDVDIITRTVDGSDLINRWSTIRELFWGFDKTELPLNGRIWLPQGEGPFPLVLILHGNHLMEDFSDNGYAYLGELLASRGFITVSLDENFVNYSAWSGGLSNDMELRSWVMLQHIEEIRELNQLTNNPLSSKVDMNRIALIGHSRGGQAAVLAADNPDIHDDIKAIIAIAPTDRLEDKRYLKMNNINYLVIQGSQDADVSTFTGDRQYERATMTNREYLFKTSLYIEGANHGQFNTQWGNMDLTLPTGLFLNKRDILDGDDQRQIAQTYIAAFLETTLMKSSIYLPMFKDYRKAADWLPTTSYRNRFEASDFIRVADFEEDHNIQTTSITNGSIHAVKLNEWKEDIVKDRQDSSKQNRSVHLSWTGQEGSYELTMPNHGWKDQFTSESLFTFSLANITDDPDMDITIEMETTDGVKLQNPLSKFMLIHPAIHTQFTKEHFLDVAIREGRYGASTEPVFQTYMIRLKEFSNGQSTFSYKSIKSIRFLFLHQREGSILIDDIGFY